MHEVRKAYLEPTLEYFHGSPLTPPSVPRGSRKRELSTHEDQNEAYALVECASTFTLVPYNCSGVMQAIGPFTSPRLFLRAFDNLNSSDMSVQLGEYCVAFLEGFARSLSKLKSLETLRKERVTNQVINFR